MERLTQLTHKGGFAAFESLDGKSIYYTKSDEGKEGLWRMSVVGGAEAQVIDSAIYRRAFAVTGDGIYFITGALSSTLEFFSLRTQQHKTLAKLENPAYYLLCFPRQQVDPVQSRRPVRQRPDAGGKLQVIADLRLWIVDFSFLNLDSTLNDFDGPVKVPDPPSRSGY